MTQTLNKSYDIVVIGAGSAGYAAARTAAIEGKSVLVVEGGKQVGGLCILRGCMPTKALLESSHRMHEIANASEFGIRVPAPVPDMAAIQKRRARLIRDFAGYRQQQLEASEKFTFFRGQARFTGTDRITVNPLGKKLRPIEVKFDKAILATGSYVQPEGIPGLDKTGCWTSDDAITAKHIPPRLVVLGGGAVAVELAQHFSRLGSQVTILQRSANLLREMDSDLSQVLAEAFQAEGITVRTSCRVISAECSAQGKSVDYLHKDKKCKIFADEILYAWGRLPATNGLNCDAAGIELTPSGAVKVGRDMRSTNKNIFAAGDVNGLFEVVHIAIQQGEIAGRNASRNTFEKWDDRLKSMVIFTDPNIATVGLSENECRERGIQYIVAYYPFCDHGKSMIRCALKGHVKILASPKSGKILGAAVVGPEGAELIHELIVAMSANMTVRKLAFTPHYHPTLSEIWTYPAEELMEKIRESN